ACAHESRREREGDDLQPVHIDAQHAGGALVLPDAAQAEAEARAVDPDGRHECDEGERQHRIEEYAARKFRTTRQDRHVKTGSAAGQSMPARRTEPEDLDDRQRSYRKIMAAQAQDDEAEGRREDRRQDARKQPSTRHRQAARLRDSARIGAEAEECRGRKRGIARIPADEVPRQRHGDEQTGAGGEAYEIIAADPRRERERNGAQSDEDEPDPVARGHAVHHSYPARPTRPAGRTSSTSSSIAKAMMVAFCGPSHTPNTLSMRPSASPPASAPDTVPSPPSTHTTKDFPSSVSARPGENGNTTAIRHPAAPAIRA